MAVYEYKAIASNGRTISDKINSEGTESDVMAQLKEMGLKPISVKKKAFDIDSLSKKLRKQPKNKAATIGLEQAVSVADVEKAKAQARIAEKANETQKSWKDLLKGNVDVKLPDLSAFLPIKIEEVISFTEMLFLLKRANFTNIRAVTTLHGNTSNQGMKNILGDMINGMENGGYIYQTMEYYPRVFPEIYINLIKVGETTGSLVNSLEQGLKYLQDSTRIKRSMKKALVGPLAQSFGLLVGGILCIIFGLPVMQDMYASYGLTDQIPEATMVAANIIYWCGEHWYVLVAAVVAIIVAFQVWVHTASGRYTFDKIKISMPIFGPLILRLQVQKFFVAVNINLRNNARLQDAISSCKTVITNYVMLGAIEAAEANLIVGDSWIEPFEKIPNFPPMVQEMLRIGMESDMPSMIENILNFIDDDIRITIEKITKVLPSVSMLFMGVILIGFVIIILKPIMEIYMGSFLFEANGM